MLAWMVPDQKTAKRLSVISVSELIESLNDNQMSSSVSTTLIHAPQATTCECMHQCCSRCACHVCMKMSASASHSG